MIKKIFELTVGILQPPNLIGRPEGAFNNLPTEDFITPHLDNEFLLTIDIEKCFNSITYEAFANAAKDKIGHPDAIKAIFFKPNLVVGLVSSAPLAEVVLRKSIDGPINKQIYGPKYKMANITYTRYYDDIYLSGNDRDALNRLKNELFAELPVSGLKINQKKSGVGKIENAVILKSKINNHEINTGKKFKNNLRYQMFRFQPITTDIHAVEKSIREVHAIIGRISHIIHAETSPAPKWLQWHKKYIDELEGLKETRRDILGEEY